MSVKSSEAAFLLHRLRIGCAKLKSVTGCIAPSTRRAAAVNRYTRMGHAFPPHSGDDSMLFGSSLIESVRGGVCDMASGKSLIASPSDKLLG